MENLTLTIETEIKFQVTQKSGKPVDTYGTGDYHTHNEFHVMRKQMACDIPIANGGTMESFGSYTNELLLRHNKTGVDKFGVFSNLKMAQIFCDALNKTNQSELLEIINSDKYKKSVTI